MMRAAADCEVEGWNTISLPYLASGVCPEGLQFL